MYLTDFKNLLLIVVFVGLFNSSCNMHDSSRNNQSTTERTTQTEVSIRELSKRWLALWSTGNADSLTALLDGDVIFIRQHNEPLMGQAAVKNYIIKKVPWRGDDWETTSVIFAPALDEAVERGVFRKLGTHREIIAIGNYVTIYRLVKGEWKIQYDAKWMTDSVVGDSLCRVKDDGSGEIICRKKIE